MEDKIINIVNVSGGKIWILKRFLVLGIWFCVEIELGN